MAYGKTPLAIKRPQGAGHMLSAIERSEPLAICHSGFLPQTISDNPLVAIDECHPGRGEQVARLAHRTPLVSAVTEFLHRYDFCRRSFTAPMGVRLHHAH